MTDIHVPDTLKMIRETLCVAQSCIGNSPFDEGRKREHIDRLQRILDDIDRQRPLGNDGKHGNLHTPTCGCNSASATTGSPKATTPRTIIEFIEPIADPSNPLCHKAKEVRVNGIPVLVKKGGIDITYGADEITTVTLELLPTEIHFRAAEPYEEPNQ